MLASVRACFGKEYPAILELNASPFFSWFLRIKTPSNFDVESKWIELWVSAWRQMTALINSFKMVTNFPKKFAYQSYNATKCAFIIFSRFVSWNLHFYLFWYEIKSKQNKSSVGRRGPYLRSWDHLGRSSEVQKSYKK